MCITALVEQTYFASVHYARAGHTDEIVIDSRPSDAINLAVRCCSFPWHSQCNFRIHVLAICWLNVFDAPLLPIS